WPEPRLEAIGFQDRPDNTVTVRILILGGAWGKPNKPPDGSQEAIRHRIMALAGKGTGYTGRSAEDPNGKDRRQTMRIGPYAGDPQAFARKIDFGTVRSVEGRVITLVVRRDKAPPDVEGKGDGVEKGAEKKQPGTAEQLV